MTIGRVLGEVLRYEAVHRTVVPRPMLDAPFVPDVVGALAVPGGVGAQPERAEVAATHVSAGLGEDGEGTAVVQLQVVGVRVSLHPRISYKVVIEGAVLLDEDHHGL